MPFWELCIAFYDTEIFRVGLSFSRTSPSNKQTKEFLIERIPTSSPKKPHQFFLKKKKNITTLFGGVITSWYQVYVRFRLESLLQTYIVINQERTYSYYSTDLREFELTGSFGFFSFFLT